VHDAYVVACIRAAKGRAHRLHCRWRTERLDVRHGLRCIVDGQSRRLDLLGRTLELDLPTVCEGVPGPLAPRDARRLGTGFADLYLVGRDVDLGEEVQMLRYKRETTVYYPLYELDTPRASVALRGRLRVTEDVVTDYALGRYADTAALEEFHTAIEQLLRELLPNAKKRANWPELIDLATSGGLLTGVPKIDALDGHDHSDVALLAQMNRQRVLAKHRAAITEDPWFVEHWECLAALVEYLASKLESLEELSPTRVS